MSSKTAKKARQRISAFMAFLFFIGFVLYLPANNVRADSASEPDFTAAAAFDHSVVDKGNNVTLNYTLTPTGNLVSRKKPVDIVLLIDDSGSMDSNSKMDYAKQAAKHFIDSFAAESNGLDNKVGIAAFDTFAYKASDLVSISNSNNVTNLKNQVDKIYAEGGTNLQEGLKVANNILGSKDNTRDKYVIVLTDGQPTYYVSNWDGNYCSVENASSDYTYWNGDDYSKLYQRWSYWSNKYIYSSYQGWTLPYTSGVGGSGNSDRNGTCASKANDEVAGMYNSDTIKTYALGVATDKGSVNENYMSEIANSGHGKYVYTTNPADIDKYCQDFLADITQAGSISNIRITQVVPDGLDVDTTSLPAGWSYDSSKRVLSGPVNDISFSSNSQTPAPISIPVKYKVLKEGTYTPATTISYIDINGVAQIKTIGSNLTANNPITTTADIAASGQIANPNVNKYDKVRLNYTVTPTGSVILPNGSKSTGNVTIKNIRVTQVIPDGLEVDTSSLPAGWNYDSSTRTVSGSFDNVIFNVGQSAPAAVTKTLVLTTARELTASIPDGNITYTKEVNTNGVIDSTPGLKTITFGNVVVSNPLTPLGRKLKVLYVHGRGQAAEISSNSDMDVTEMTTEGFISNTLMDLNGKYDLIYFGKGTGKGAYNSASNPLDTTESWLTTAQRISPYDITIRMADKVDDFINSNQLVVFNNDVFADSQSNFSSRFNTPAKIAARTIQVNDPVTGNMVTKQRVYAVNSETEADLVQKYIQLGSYRPDLNVTSAPQNYTQNPAGTSDKTLHFEYTAKSIENRPLTLKLYLDKNGDGKFGYIDTSDPNPNKKDLELVLSKTITVDPAHPNATQTLDYTINSKMLTGLLYWKLEVCDDRGEIAEKVDSLLYKDKEISMKVLQIMPNNGTGGRSSAGSYGNLQTLFSTLKEGGHELGVIPGVMNIDVKSIVASDFNKPEVYNNLNGKYDMIVVGFDDCYSKPGVTFSTAAIKALQDYIKTGQGVMFSHDTIWGSGNDEIKQAFASLAGQKPQSTRYCNNGGLDGTNSLAAKEVGGYTGNVTSTPATSDILREKVRKVNDSAITNFPYQLPDVINVAATHVQYYRLNLEIADPWYNMYDDLATGKRVIDNDDSVSSYYTYSVGNVTFSGTGHTTQDFQNKDDEVKLFANTIIRAFAGANHAPDLTVTSPIDNQKIATADTKIPVDFTISDPDVYDQATGVLKASIYIDKNDGNGYQQISQLYTDTDNDGTPDTLTALTNSELKCTSDEKVRVDVPKLAGASNFKIKIEAVDTKGAKCDKEISMQSLDQLALQANLNIDKTQCLIGDSVNITAMLTALGAEAGGKIDNIKLDTNINRTSVGFSNIIGGTNTTVVAGGNSKLTVKPNDINYDNTTGKPSPATENISCAAKFSAADSYTITNTLSYYVDGTLGASPVIPTSTIDVRDGTANITVKDSSGAGVANISVKVSDSSTGVVKGTIVTDSTGKATIDKLPSGSYDFDIVGTLDAKYIKPNKITKPLSYLTSTQQVDFTLGNASPTVTNHSIKAIVNGTETTDLSMKKDDEGQLIIRFNLQNPKSNADIKLACENTAPNQVDFDINSVIAKVNDGVSDTNVTAAVSATDSKIIKLSGLTKAGDYVITVKIKGKNNSTTESASKGLIKLDNINIYNDPATPTNILLGDTLNFLVYNKIRLG